MHYINKMRTTKNLVFIVFFVAFLFSGCKKTDCSYYSNDNAQTLEHDGLTREYVVYIPSTYDGNSAVSVVLNFHGFGGLASEYMTEADMRPQAESDTFLLIYPQGGCLDGFSHWNASLPGIDNKSDVDDLGFIGALIDQLTSDYNIDKERIYACGYSNGGMMSYALACYQSERIAAIGSISGCMVDQSSSCVPSHPMPVIKLHGTSDDVLPYNGDSDYASAQSTIDYWVNFNNANTTAALETDGNIEHYVYANGDSSVSVEHYKYIGGGHVWFNTTYQGSNASQLVCDFFSQYDVNGLR
jgi:polyhydroxybutyrate depolymerase